MKPKLLSSTPFKTALGEYVPAQWTGGNTSGRDPIGDRVLILPDDAADITAGGIHLTADLVGRHSMAAEAGVLVAAGEGAFTWNSDRQTPFAGRKPQPGDRVCIERYSGQLITGDDGKVYRLCESVCIGAVIKGKDQ